MRVFEAFGRGLLSGAFLVLLLVTVGAEASWLLT